MIINNIIFSDILNLEAINILNGKSFSVDVRKDYIEANKFIKRDKIFKRYR